MLPARTDLEGFQVPGTDDAIGQEQDDQDVYRAQKEVGLFTEELFQTIFQQAVNGSTNQRPTLGANTADQGHQ